MKGIDRLADVVGSTMGAKGRNVILDRGDNPPMVINDGVGIAKRIFFKDPLENCGAQLIRDAANRTNHLAGDGTTGSIVLARAIVKQGWEAVDKGANPVQLRRELENAKKKVEESLKKAAKLVEDEKRAVQIAQVSVQDEELGQKIGKLMHEIGKDGAVTIKSSVERGVFFEKCAGIRMEGALKGGILDSEDRWESKLNNAKILILKDSPEDHEYELKWIPFMKQMMEGERLPDGNVRIDKVNTPQFLIIAEKLSNRFIQAMRLNNEYIKWVWFRPSTANKNMKEIYKDVNSVIGGKMIEDSEGVYLREFKIADLGEAEAIKVNRHEIVITVEDEQPNLQLNCDRYLDRVRDVKGQILNAEDETEQEQIKERYANLTGGVATIRVSSSTESETHELSLRIEDAVNATRSAMDEGYLPGGGVALLDSSKGLGQTDGERILYKACESSLIQILKNAGYENIEKKLKNCGKGKGYNVLNDTLIDLCEEGIVDPLKVIRLSLEHAVSVAGLLLTSEYSVMIDEDDGIEKVKDLLK
jgi:chaperonin GroEL